MICLQYQESVYLSYLRKYLGRLQSAGDTLEELIGEASRDPSLYVNSSWSLIFQVALGAVSHNVELMLKLSVPDTMADIHRHARKAIEPMATGATLYGRAIFRLQEGDERTAQNMLTGATGHFEQTTRELPRLFETMEETCR